MERWYLDFLEPWWLAGLVLAPLVVFMGRRSLAGLGPYRQWLAIGLRTLVLGLLLAALAGPEIVRESNQVCTLFLLDGSQSISSDDRDAGLAIVGDAIAARPEDEDLAGVIVFGRHPRIELPPALYPRDRKLRTITSQLDRQYTDIGSAIQLALGAIPPNARGRLVLISDGNENRGQVLPQAVAASEAKVPIDVVPIEYRYDSEILVDKVSVPAELKRGDVAALKVVIRSGRAAAGILRLFRLADGERETLAEERVELRAGLNVQYLKQQIDEPNFYNYEATFEPDLSSEDKMARNNTATGFTWVRGEGRVLFITDKQDEHRALIDALRKDNLVVIVRRPVQLSDDMAELRAFDTVILGDVPAEELGEQRQELLATNTSVLGAGLVMLGGPDSFGPGGYNDSPLEKALPVDMEVKSTKITGKGALVLIMHACELPEGNFWQKKTAQLAVGQLSAQDECGLIQWDGKTAWAFKLQPVGDKNLMMNRIDRMVPGDMPDFAPSMQMGFDALKTSDAMTKHVIVISDGDPAPPQDQLLAQFKQAKISVTSVAIAAHGAFERQVMRRISTVTGGRYYEVTNPKTLPAIYTKETRAISRPLLYERGEGWSPRIDFGGEPIAGLDRSAGLPAIKGFVLTTPKATSVVEISSPLPAELSSNPILAHWQFGLGRSVAFTSDAGQRWAVGWQESPIYAKFWSQLVRWSMRAVESERLQISTQERDGSVKVVVNAAEANGEFLNMLALEGSLVRPDGKTEMLSLTQTEPGKYEAEVTTEQAGSYVVRVGASDAEGKRESAFAALSVSYPPEFRETTSRRGTMENIALVTGGRVIERDRAASANFFERSSVPVRHPREAWPLFLLAALIAFFLDVAVRRIAVEWAQVTGGIRRWWSYLRRQPLPVTAPATLERLRTAKSQVDEDLKSRRFEPTSPLESPEVVFPTHQETTSTPSSSPPAATTENEGKEGDSHTSRLLKAKRQVWEDRDKKT